MIYVPNVLTYILSKTTSFMGMEGVLFNHRLTKLKNSQITGKLRN